LIANRRGGKAWQDACEQQRCQQEYGYQNFFHLFHSPCIEYLWANVSENTPEVVYLKSNHLPSERAPSASTSEPTGIATSAVTVPSGKLAANTQYYWRVSASNTYGESPFSSSRDFTTSVMLEPRIALEYASDSGFGLALNAGFRYRVKKSRLNNLDAGDEITFGAAVEIPIKRNFFSFLAEAYGALGITDFGELQRRGFACPILPSALELFFRDEPMQLARWPNHNWTRSSSRNLWPMRRRPRRKAENAISSKTPRASQGNHQPCRAGRRLHYQRGCNFPYTTKPENFRAMIDAVMEYGIYDKNIKAKPKAASSKEISKIES
jgi:hypothetical protein